MKETIMQTAVCIMVSWKFICILITASLQSIHLLVSLLFCYSLYSPTKAEFATCGNLVSPVLPLMTCPWFGVLSAIANVWGESPLTDQIRPLRNACTNKQVRTQYVPTGLHWTSCVKWAKIALSDSCQSEPIQSTHQSNGGRSGWHSDGWAGATSKVKNHYRIITVWREFTSDMNVNDHHGF